jgi:uncharacterized membrane protein
MSTSLFSYVITLVLFVAVDIVWLAGPGRSFYVDEIGNLLRAQPNLVAAGAFYLLYSVGLTYFGVMPGLTSAAPLDALFHGALFGLIAYATYDLTNLAVLNGFTTKIALIDMVWGSLLSGTVAWVVCRLVLASGIGQN